MYPNENLSSALDFPATKHFGRSNVVDDPASRSVFILALAVILWPARRRCPLWMAQGHRWLVQPVRYAGSNGTNSHQQCRFPFARPVRRIWHRLNTDVYHSGDQAAVPVILADRVGASQTQICLSDARVGTRLVGPLFLRIHVFGI